MKKDENIGSQELLNRRIDRLDGRTVWYILAFFALLALTGFVALRDNARPVSLEGAEDYPVAYSAISGSDAEVSPSDVAERAENYITQFREFDRAYCYEYWVQCQSLLASDPDYAPDEELTKRAREDYERYVLVVRAERETSRALREKLILTALCGGLACLAGVLLIVNRGRRFVLVRRLIILEENE